MPNVTFAGATYACAVAVKGHNYIELKDAKALPICRFDEITNFDAFVITDGEWSDPPAVQSVTASEAVLTGGNIVLTTDPAQHVGTGTLVKFNAPCDCTAVTGGLTISGKTYTVVNTMGAKATGTGGAWSAGAQIAVLIDSANSRAFLQGGGGAPAEHTHAASDITGGTFAGQVAANSNGQDPVSYVLRNQKLSASEETPTANGAICWLYE